MKLAIVSDIHGNLPALETFINEVKKYNVDKIINLGDCLSGPLWPEETAHLLIKQDWFHLAGNHDRNLLTENPELLSSSDKYAYHTLSKESFKWLKSLPELIIFEDILMCHGSPENNNVYLIEKIVNGNVENKSTDEIIKLLPDNSIQKIICGHSHIPAIIEDQKLNVYNPGSIGLQAYDDDKPEYHIMQTGSPEARFLIIELLGENVSAEIIKFNYDFESTAKQALTNGRKDWEKALLTGRLKT